MVTTLWGCFATEYRGLCYSLESCYYTLFSDLTLRWRRWVSSAFSWFQFCGLVSPSPIPQRDGRERCRVRACVYRGLPFLTVFKPLALSCCLFTLLCLVADDGSSPHQCLLQAVRRQVCLFQGEPLRTWHLQACTCSAINARPVFQDQA
jgi:hypothetical protein